MLLQVLYTPLEPIRVKGKRMPVEIYAVSSLRSADSLALPLPLPLVQQSQPDSLSSSPEKRPLPDPAPPGSTALAGGPALPLSELPHRVLSSHFSGSDAGAAKPWIGGLQLSWQAKLPLAFGHCWGARGGIGGVGIFNPPTPSAQSRSGGTPCLLLVFCFVFASLPTPAGQPCAGREAVVDTIVARVRQLVEEQAGGVVLIEGEPGELCAASAEALPLFASAREACLG